MIRGSHTRRSGAPIDTIPTVASLREMWWWRGPKAKGRPGAFERWLTRDFTPEMLIASREKALARAIRLSGPDSLPAANARRELAQQLEQHDRWTEAQLLRQEAFDAMRRHLGDEDPYTISAELWLAVNLQHQGFVLDAKPLFEHAYAVRWRTLGPDDKLTRQAAQFVAGLDEGEAEGS